MKIRKTLIWCMLSLFYLVPATAWSQASGIYDTSDNFISGWIRETLEGSCTTNDMFFTLLYKIIGDPCFEMGGSGNINILQYVLGYINIIALIFVLLMIMWASFVAAIDAAANASVKKNQSVPLRLAIAFALLLPVPQLNNYSNSQMIVLKVIGWGVGSSEFLTKATVKGISDGVPLVTEIRIPPKIVLHNADILKNMLCSGAMVVRDPSRPFASYINEDGSSGIIMAGESFEKANNARLIGFGVTGTSKQVCGYIDFTKDENYDPGDSDYQRDSLAMAYAETRSAYIQQIDKLSNLAKKFYDQGGEYNVGSVNNFITETLVSNESSINSKFNLGVEAYIRNIGDFAGDIEQKMYKVSVSSNDATKAYMENFSGNAGVSNIVLTFFRAKSLTTNANMLMNRTLPTISNAEMPCTVKETSNDHSIFQSFWKTEKVCDFYDGLNDHRMMAGKIHAAAMERAKFGDLPNVSGTESLVEDLISDPSCEAGQCDGQGIKKAFAYTFNTTILNAIDTVSFGSNGNTGFDFTTLKDPIQTTQNVGATFFSAGLILFGLIMAGSALAEGIGSSLAGLVGGAAISGAIRPVISVTWIAMAYLFSLSPAMIVVIPSSIIITVMFALMAYLTNCIAGLGAVPIATARMVVKEGEGVLGQRNERMLMMAATLFVQPSTIVLGVAAYFTVLPYAFAFLGFNMYLVSQITSGVSNILATVVMFTMWFALWHRMNLWLANSLVFIGDKILEMLGTIHALASESEKINGIVQEMGGASKSFIQNIGTIMGNNANKSMAKGIQRNAQNNVQVGVSDVQHNG
ncbi:DotA/TraY family protein [Halomonas heilongjiangensis]|uniref:Conjugal transfer protein TraG n=1 Tax=Halomonas heilongjiangensis TaxID=1387883 RepID=A0A2N7TU76_9GAMM|nr:DotA/TraY family protein [Halomonas heilongjiangensis]PMR71749.1 hypothetical protein C1H66_01535 [Halomonas heilongjiangensis]PXX89973.1 hypothetical protein CR158_10340 [Halomonas heilongjiangensis]